MSTEYHQPHLIFGPKPTPAVIAYVTRCNSGGIELLVAPRVRNGKLTLPGGKVQPGETYLHALLRELWEEARYTPPRTYQGPPFCVVEGAPYALHPFAIFDNNAGITTAEPHKHGDWEWLRFSDLTSNITSGKLPPQILNPNVLSFIINYHFFDNYPHIPAGFLLNDYPGRLLDFQKTVYHHPSAQIRRRGVGVRG